MIKEETKGPHDPQQQSSFVPTWYWKETRNHLVSENLPLWKKFEPHLNRLIESAYSSQQPTLLTRDFTIDFKSLVMSTTSGDVVTTFPISRKTEEEEKTQTSETDSECFTEGLKYSPLILGEWFKRNIPKMYGMTYIEKIRYAVKAACSGVMAKAQQLRDDENGKKLVKILMEDIEETNPERILQAAAYAYSHPSFLYRETNSFLRNSTVADIDILGPFCFLLNEYIWLTEVKRVENSMRSSQKLFRGTLYRSIPLSIEDIYKSFPLKDKLLRLTSFTSTTPEKGVAMEFLNHVNQTGRLLLEIEVPEETGLFCSSISDIAYFPLEKEVLLPPGSVLLVKERFTSDEGIHMIQGTLLPNKQASYNLTTLKEYIEKASNQANNLKLLYQYLETSKKTPIFGKLTDIFSKQPKSQGIQGKITWFWKANQNPWAAQEAEIWKEYTKDETKAIEKAYKSSQKEAQVGNSKYKINFEKMIQINTENTNFIRPVKRIDDRQERKRELLLYESIGKYLSPLIVTWQAEFLLEFGAPILKHIGILTDLIALGVIEEGKIQQQESVGKTLTTKLKQVVSKSNFNIEEVFKCLARMYTEEAFLYKSVNKALRENDLTKADTLGAFCLLFNELITYFDTIKKYPYSGVVWRGSFIDESILNTYYPDKEPFIYWPAFSSTSKDRAAAERFMANVLFEIRLYDKGVDVEQLSEFKAEREVLIHSGSAFKVIDHKMIREGVHHIILSSQTY